MVTQPQQNSPAFTASRVITVLRAYKTVLDRYGREQAELSLEKLRIGLTKEECQIVDIQIARLYDVGG